MKVGISLTLILWTLGMAQISWADALCSSSNLSTIKSMSHAYCATQVSAAEPLPNVVLKSASQCLWGMNEGAENSFKAVGYLFKSLVLEAPPWLFSQMKEAVSKTYSQDDDLISLADEVALENIKHNQPLWDKAKEYYSAYQEFMKMVVDQIEKNWQEFKCLPIDEQVKIFCRFSMEIFGSYVTGSAIIKGISWTAGASKAIAGFIGELKNAPGYQNLGFAEKMQKATSQINARGTSEIIHQISRNERVVEYTNQLGEKYLKFEKYSQTSDGKMMWVGRELAVDAKTGALDANGGIAKDFLNSLIRDGSNKSSVIFMDVNNLGKVNYFKGGFVSGDKYLEAVGSSLKESARHSDFVFKTGGDELVIVASSNEPKTVMGIAQRLSDSVAKNPDAKAVFFQEKVALAKEYRELSATIKSSTSAGQDVSALKQQLATLEQQIIKQSSYRPSVSIGSTYIKEGDTFETVFTRASDQAGFAKSTYKEKVGLDTEKYRKGSSTAPFKRDVKAQPEVFPPVEP